MAVSGSARTLRVLIQVRGYARAQASLRSTTPLVCVDMFSSLFKKKTKIILEIYRFRV